MSPVSTRAETAAPASEASIIDWSALHREWHHDRSVRTKTTRVYIPTTVDLPISRFRSRIEFKPDGVLRILTLGNTDRHRMVEGTWSRTGNTMTVRYMHPEHPDEERVWTFDVENLSPTELRVRP